MLVQLSQNIDCLPQNPERGFPLPIAKAARYAAFMRVSSCFVSIISSPVSLPYTYSVKPSQSVSQYSEPLRVRAMKP